MLLDKLDKVFSRRCNEHICNPRLRGKSDAVRMTMNSEKGRNNMKIMSKLNRNDECVHSVPDR